MSQKSSTTRATADAFARHLPSNAAVSLGGRQYPHRAVGSTRRVQHSEIMIFTAGSFALLAMGLQNTIMRLILNNLPPTTVMADNITKMLSDIVAYACRFSSFRPSVNERGSLEHQTQRMSLTLLSFLDGALVAAFTYANAAIRPVYSVSGDPRVNPVRPQDPLRHLA